MGIEQVTVAGGLDAGPDTHDSSCGLRTESERGTEWGPGLVWNVDWVVWNKDEVG